MTVGRGIRGFTLIEMMITITLLSVVIGGILGVVIGVQRDYVRQRDVQRSQEALRAAETAITTVLRSAKADPFETGNATIDPDPLGHASWDNLRVVSDHNPADGDFADPLEDVQFWVDADSLKVRWQSGGPAQVLAYPVQEVRFDYYDDDGGTLTTAAAVDSFAARVQVTMRADRGVRSSAVDRLETTVHLRN